MAGLGNSQYEQDPKATEDSHVDPEQPPPSLVCCDITADDQCKRRPSCAGETVDGHRWAAFVSGPKIADGAARILSFE